MQKGLIHILLTVVLAFALGSCVFEVDYEPAPAPVRVLLVYVGTDNNLSGYEQTKIQGLREGWTGNPNDRIIVYRDNRSGQARLMEISNLVPGEQPREIGRYGDADEMSNSASPQTLNRVITDVLDMYPDADSYGLLVFSHASGWLPPGAYNDLAAGKIPQATPTVSASRIGSRSVIIDGTDEMGASGHTGLTAKSPQSRSIIIDGDDEMDIKDFAEAIPDGVFDYIVFEACFMAGVEVAYELRNKTPLILASSAEIVDPGFAPVYPAATGRLFSADLTSFGQSVFNHALTYAENNPQRSATYSVIRTAGLEPLADFVRENCDFTRTLNIGDIQHFDRLTTAKLFFDFGDYYSRLLDSDAQRAELSRLIAECVAWKAATNEFMTQGTGYNGFTIDKHSGLTTYIRQERFAGLNAVYRNLGWVKAVTPFIAVDPWVVHEQAEILF